MTRTEARESLMQMLFQMEIQKDFTKDAAITFAENNIDDDKQLVYFNEVFEAYSSHRFEIDAIIEASSKGWKLERIAKVDLAVLRLAIAEFKFKEGEQVPVSASISEAVKIAKKFGGEDSGRFVNGVLGAVSRA